MIGIEGSYQLSIDLEGAQDIVTPHDLIELKIIEEAGNTLPVFEMTIIVRNPKLSSYLNSSNTIRFGIGRDINSTSYSRFKILGKERLENGTDGHILKIVGMLDSIKYANGSVVYANGETSFNVIKEIASQYFKFESDLPNSDDKMNWWSMNETPQKFITHAWLHSNHPNELPLLGITSQGVFRYLSLVKRLQGKPDWTFTANLNDRSPNSVQLEAAPTIISNIAQNSAIIGLPKSKIVHQLAGAKKTKIMTPSALKVINTGEETELKAGTQLSRIAYVCENTHEKYQEMRDYNSKALLSLDNYNARCVFRADYKNIQILDTVMLKDDNFLINLNSNYSGIWLVKKVARIIRDKVLYTVVTLCKDGINDLSATNN